MRVVSCGNLLTTIDDKNVERLIYSFKIQEIKKYLHKESSTIIVCIRRLNTLPLAIR